MSDLDLTRLAADFAVSPQLEPADMAAVAAAGFRSVINHRPDREGGAQQPLSAELATAAAAAGLRYVYMPVVPSAIDEHVVAAFGRHLEQLPRPILAFCYTGGRAARLYRLATEG